jgi:hypothetical protein
MERTLAETDLGGIEVLIAGDDIFSQRLRQARLGKAGDGAGA